MEALIEKLNSIDRHVRFRRISEPRGGGYDCDAQFDRGNVCGPVSGHGNTPEEAIEACMQRIRDGQKQFGHFF